MHRTLSRYGSVALIFGQRTLQVERSRHLGSEAAPKTPRARRTIRLTRGNAAMLKPLIELKARPQDHLFKNVRAEPIEAANFHICSAMLTARCRSHLCEISALRRDTYISLALTNGVPLTWLSEQTGAAVATILKHYERFIHSHADRRFRDVQK
jgi:hypothetical protein